MPLICAGAGTDAEGYYAPGRDGWSHIREDTGGAFRTTIDPKDPRTTVVESAGGIMVITNSCSKLVDEPAKHITIRADQEGGLLVAVAGKRPRPAHQGCYADKHESWPFKWGDPAPQAAKEVTGPSPGVPSTQLQPAAPAQPLPPAATLPSEEPGKVQPGRRGCGCQVPGESQGVPIGWLAVVAAVGLSGGGRSRGHRCAGARRPAP